MSRPIVIAISLLVGGAAIASACGGDSKKDATGTPEAQSTGAKTAAPTTATELPATSAPSRTYSETQAKALLDDASLTAKDVGADWTITSDKLIDNTVAAEADPAGAASFKRCGRMAGRLVTTGPADIVSAYLGGSVVSVFSQLTVYATAAGAADCSVEEARRFSQPGTLARRFGSAFVDPDLAVVKVLEDSEYPQVGDGSFAASVTGETNATGTRVGLQIVIVGFLKGNTSAIVGVAHAPRTDLSTKELQRYVDLVLQRISEHQ